MFRSDRGSTSSGFALGVVAALMVVAFGYLLTGGSPDPSPTLSGTSAAAPSGVCGEWDDTSLGKSFSMRARSCASLEDGLLSARGRAKVDERWGDAFHSFELHLSVVRDGRVVADEVCDFTSEANAGTNGNAFSWSEDSLLCDVTVPVEPGRHEVKVDVFYDLEGDFGAGVQHAADAEAVTVVA